MTAKMLKIQLGPSKILAGILILAHGIGWISICLIPLHLALLGVLSLPFVFSLFYFLGRDAWRRLPHSIIMFEINADCSCRYLDYQGRWHAAVIVPTILVNPWLSVLTLRINNRRHLRYIVVLPDAVEPDAFRQLRVWLKWKCISL